MNDIILDIKNLSVSTRKTKYKTGLKIVKNVRFSVASEEVVGVVGESGCGKSVAMMSILRLFSKNIKITEGEILFNNDDLVKYDDRRLRKIAGKDIGMIFQEPMKYLNPLMTVKAQLAEPMKIHTSLSKKEIMIKSLDLLKKVGIRNAEHVLECLPYELSGGMRQRILIAMAISCNPKLLIADEPTTALDVTVQAQILKIIKKLVEEEHMSMIIISHDLGVISELADKIVVMYAGEVVEIAAASDIFANPLHPYTEQLLISAKEINGENKVLTILEGSVPRIDENIEGCRFYSRCKYRSAMCKTNNIDMKSMNSNTRFIRCIKYNEGE